MRNFDEDGNFIETDPDPKDLKENTNTINYILKKKKTKEEDNL